MWELWTLFRTKQKFLKVFTKIRAEIDKQTNRKHKYFSPAMKRIKNLLISHTYGHKTAFARYDRFSVGRWTFHLRSSWSDASLFCWTWTASLFHLFNPFCRHWLRFRRGSFFSTFAFVEKCATKVREIVSKIKWNFTLHWKSFGLH